MSGTTHKIRILYVMKILLEKTDDSHFLTLREICNQLQQYGITAERKSIYNDIENLRQFGLDIIGIKGDRTYYYHMGSREFELAELKLLVDSVQAAKFITYKKSGELIKKIESLASEYERTQLQRQVFIGERNKTLNENVYYNIDRIYTAISKNVQITFQYVRWNVNKEQELKKDGALYHASPWALMWEDENYYLIAYDSEAKDTRHFRVDKMIHIELTHRSRQEAKNFQPFDMGTYSKKMFAMFDGVEEVVQIQCANEFAGVMIDRFGKDVPFQKVDEEHFQCRVKVAVSRQFLGWIMALGEGVRIVGPQQVLDMIRKEVERYQRQYLDDNTT